MLNTTNTPLQYNIPVLPGNLAKQIAGGTLLSAEQYNVDRVASLQLHKFEEYEDLLSYNAAYLAGKTAFNVFLSEPLNPRVKLMQTHLEKLTAAGFCLTKVSNATNILETGRIMKNDITSKTSDNAAEYDKYEYTSRSYIQGFLPNDVANCLKQKIMMSPYVYGMFQSMASYQTLSVLPQLVYSAVFPNYYDGSVQLNKIVDQSTNDRNSINTIVKSYKSNPITFGEIPLAQISYRTPSQPASQPDMTSFPQKLKISSSLCEEDYMKLVRSIRFDLDVKLRKQLTYVTLVDLKYGRESFLAEYLVKTLSDCYRELYLNLPSVCEYSQKVPRCVFECLGMVHGLSYNEVRKFKTSGELCREMGVTTKECLVQPERKPELSIGLNMSSPLARRAISVIERNLEKNYTD